MAADFPSRYPTGEPTAPPPGTRITREELPDRAVAWCLPASGRSGGFLIFGLFWCALSGVITFALLVPILKGEPVRGNMPDWLVLPFFGAFWAAGLGMLYAGLRQKYAEHRLYIDPSTVELTRRLFGRSKTSSLRTDDVQAVELVEFYRQNYTPVRGIEIRGERRKLRFGSILTAEEKKWLVSDIRTAIFGPPLPVEPPAARDTFTFVVPASAGFVSLIVAVVALGVIISGVISFFVLFPSRASSFDITFALLWLVGTGVSVIGTLSFLKLLFTHTRKREMRLEATPAEVAIRTYDATDRVLSEQIFPRASVQDLRSKGAGHVNGKNMSAISLTANSETHALRYFVPAAEADKFVHDVRAALGWPPLPDDDDA